MDSINENQAEDNFEALAGEAAVKKIKEVVDKAQTCFFCTGVALGPSSGARPMNVRQVDNEGNLWFLSADDSHKNSELEQDREVNLFFAGSPHSDFMHLLGTATISRDKDKIKALWEPVIKTWFTGGVDDPRITVIKFKTLQGYYWDTKHGNAIAGIKMMIGAAVGKTMDDGVEGTLMP